MNRKNIFIISILVLAVLAGGALILFDRPNTEVAQDSLPDEAIDRHEETVEPSPADEVAADGQETGTDTVDDKEAAEVSVEQKEIKVINNSPEYDLAANLCKAADGREWLKLEYYSDGIRTTAEFGTDKIPEVSGIDAAYLNVKYSRVYLVLKEKEDTAGFAKTTVYSCGLKEGTSQKLYENTGKFTSMYFTKNLKYLGFSYFDSPASSVFQEESLISVTRCDNDQFMVKDSRTPKGDLIGASANQKDVRSYEFLSWHSNTTAKLREAGKELFYDVEKNIFVNADGTPVAADKDPGENEEKQSDSEPLKVLKDFYTFLSSEESYPKALDLLSEDFKLELGILKQFGVDELGKKDIDLESASMYSSILRMASLERIVKEETSGDASTIYFYQLLSMGEGEPARFPIAAHLKKSDGKWKILDAREADANQKPFTE